MVASNAGTQLVLDGFSSVYTAADQRLDRAYEWCARLPLCLTMDGTHATTDRPVRVLRPMGCVVTRALEAELIGYLSGLKLVDR